MPTRAATQDPRVEHLNVKSLMLHCHIVRPEPLFRKPPRLTENSEHLPYGDAARWTSVAADYERWAEPFTSQYARAALALAGGVVPGERVLDVAAGTGALALAAAEAGARVLATDFSPGMVARLGERLTPFAGSEARVMDGQALEVADGAFDAGFSIFGVIAFADWRRGLTELVRATRPGGRVVVSSWADRFGGGPGPLFMQTYRETFPEAPVPEPQSSAALCAPDVLRAELIAAGCGEVVVHAVDGGWGGSSVDAVMDTLGQTFGLMPLYAAFDQSERERLHGPLRAAIERHSGPDGVVRVTTTANVAIGRRS